MMVEVNPGNIDKNDYYIRYKKLFIRLSIISGILLAVLLLGSDGKFYSNINGIKTNTSTGKWYFVFLGGTLASIMIFAVFIACVAEAKKREKGIYPERGF